MKQVVEHHCFPGANFKVINQNIIMHIYLKATYRNNRIVVNSGLKPHTNTNNDAWSKWKW